MTRTVFVTGAAGFIGGVVARTLRERGDDVVAVVRDPANASHLTDLGVRLVAGDLGTSGAIREAMRGSDAVIHVAGMYKVGIPASKHPAMYAANVGLTELVLDAAIAEEIPRIVDISTVNVFGNTHGQVRDESFHRDPAAGFLSYYDETKYLAHEAAAARIATGAPIVIVQPGTTYGPGDHSALGAQLEAAYRGTLRFTGSSDLGIAPTHVDDLAAGIVAALDRGRVGESFVMCGKTMRLREALAIAARAGGHRLPRIDIPNAPIVLAARFLPNGSRLLGLEPNLRETVASSVGVTYWATSAKATAELGFTARDLATGVRDAFGPP